MNKIDGLREKIQDIDHKLITLIGERIGLAKQIGEQKKDANIPLRNWEVEKSVHDHAGQIAKKLGISPDLIKAVMQLLLKESRIQQEILHYSAHRGDKEDILIIGGLGDMGRWFSYFFQNQGHNVSIFDICGTSADFTSFNNLEKGLQKASFALVATPLDEVPLVIDSLIELNYKNVIFDIASLKSHLQTVVENARENSVHIASLHPMFGPQTRTLSDKVMCFCDCGDAYANQKVESLFQNTAVTMVKLGLQEHDRLISFVLGLSHVINIIFIKTIMQGGYDYSKLKSIASTTFLSQMITAQSVLNENPSLYYAIQRLNPFKDELYDNLMTAVQTITQNIIQGNGQEFLSLMAMGKKWLGT